MDLQTMLFTTASCLRPLLQFCFVVLVGVCLSMTIALPVQAASPEKTAIEAAEDPTVASPVFPKFLTLEALPAGFVSATSDETQSCQMVGEVTAFVLKREQQPMELICNASFSLASATENPEQAEAVRKIYDAILQNPQTLVAQAKAMGVADVRVLKQLQGIGEVATGFSKTELGIGQTEVLLFRRGDFINSVLIRYEVDHEPIIPLRSVARKVDRQVSQYIVQTLRKDTATPLSTQE